LLGFLSFWFSFAMKTYHALQSKAAGVLFAIALQALLVEGLVVTTSNDPLVLGAAAVGSAGLVLVTQTYTGSSVAAGTFTSGPFGIGKGVILTSGKVTDAPITGTTISHPSYNNGAAGSSLCTAIVGTKYTTYDSSVLTLNVTVPAGYNGITTRFVFASEEYPK
jgi:hypothetical protein